MSPPHRASSRLRNAEPGPTRTEQGYQGPLNEVQLIQNKGTELSVGELADEENRLDRKIIRASESGHDEFAYLARGVVIIVRLI